MLAPAPEKPGCKTDRSHHNASQVHVSELRSPTQLARLSACNAIDPESASIASRLKMIRKKYFNALNTESCSLPPEEQSVPRPDSATKSAVALLAPTEKNTKKAPSRDTSLARKEEKEQPKRPVHTRTSSKSPDSSLIEEPKTSKHKGSLLRQASKGQISVIKSGASSHREAARHRRKGSSGGLASSRTDLNRLQSEKELVSQQSSQLAHQVASNEAPSAVALHFNGRIKQKIELLCMNSAAQSKTPATEKSIKLSIHKP